jgi:hypothetical protein
MYIATPSFISDLNLCDLLLVDGCLRRRRRIYCQFAHFQGNLINCNTTAIVQISFIESFDESLKLVFCLIKS